MLDRAQLQADEDTFLQLEFWDENVDLIRRSAAIIRKAGRQHRVIVGAPQNAKIWQMCGQEMPEASRILPDSEVIPHVTACIFTVNTTRSSIGLQA